MGKVHPSKANMKTAEEIIDALWNGVDEGERSYSKVLVMEAMKSYAKSACREQREICAEKAEIISDYGGSYIDEDSIKNASEPKLS